MNLNQKKKTNPEIETEIEKNPENTYDGNQESAQKDKYKDKTAFKGKLFERDYKIRNGKDISHVGINKRQSIISAINAQIKKHKQVIFYRIYKVKLNKINSEGQDVTKSV